MGKKLQHLLSTSSGSLYASGSIPGGRVTTLNRGREKETGNGG